MRLNNRCYTYFVIKGDFEPSYITATLNLSPSMQRRIGDLRKDGHKFEFAMWEYGRCNNYDCETENQMMRTIEDLVPKIQELKEIKHKFDVHYTLEVVPSIYVGNSTPSLTPNRAVIEFCYLTQTDIDIDLYLLGSNDEDE